jgi:hypothetical protein
LEVYSDPKIRHFKLTLLPEHSSEDAIDSMLESVIGKLIIKTRFRGNPFKLPVNILDTNNVQIEAPKTVTVVIKNVPSESIVCSGNLSEVAVFKEINNFQELKRHPGGYKLYKFTVDERVEAANIVIVKGIFKMK